MVQLLAINPNDLRLSEKSRPEVHGQRDEEEEDESKNAAVLAFSEILGEVPIRSALEGNDFDRSVNNNSSSSNSSNNNSHVNNNNNASRGKNKYKESLFLAFRSPL